jgi:hypothetical protein
MSKVAKDASERPEDGSTGQVGPSECAFRRRGEPLVRLRGFRM